MSVGIGEIVKLDQKNRLHIPKNVMRVLGIEDNSTVIVTLDLEGNDACNKVYPASEYIEQRVISEFEEGRL